MPPFPADELSDAINDKAIVNQIYDLARAIPEGRVSSYGALGARCEPPISGYICGRIMNRAHYDVPWWRVVAKDGALPVSKRSPHLAQTQRRTLEEEGIEFDEAGKVKMSEFAQ